MKRPTLFHGPPLQRFYRQTPKSQRQFEIKIKIAEIESLLICLCVGTHNQSGSGSETNESVVSHAALNSAQGDLREAGGRGETKWRDAVKELEGELSV